MIDKENSSIDDAELSKNSSSANLSPENFTPEQKPKKLFGIFSVLIRLILALAIVGGAVFLAQDMINNRPEVVKRAEFERSFTVATITAQPETFRQEILAFGEVVAALNLNIRAPAAGEVIFVAPNLRPGGFLEAGQVLVKVDPFDYELARSDAQTALADARSSLAEEEEQLRIQTLNIEFAQNSLDLAEADLERAKTLFASGSVTSQQLESRELLLFQRDQALRQAQSETILRNQGVLRRQSAIENALRSLERADRALAETTIITPFDAVVVSSNVVPGATFGQGEEVASVYQANALEVRFTLSQNQYGELLSEGLIGRKLEVIWDVKPEIISASGTISRIGAQINAADGGVELFAVLDREVQTSILPGAFVSVNLTGRSFENVLSIPETSLYSDGQFYVIEDGRMRSVQAKVLARNGENLIVDADVEAGAQIIVTRITQAGDGVLVTIEGQEGRNQENNNGAQDIEQQGDGAPISRPGGR